MAINQDLKTKSSRGLLWNIVENFSQQLLAFVIGVVLARMLSPSDYGTVGALSIFLALANVFVDCGFGQAIIRKTDRSQKDLSTAFYFNLAMSLFAYVVLFIISPAVANFFEMPLLKPILRIMGLMVVFNALSLVQNSLLIVEFKLRTIAIVNVSSQLIMGTVGIYYAYLGFGVWTLVIQQVGASVLKTILFWILSKWRPTLEFSRQSFKFLFDFGWKLLGANIIGTFFMQINNFIVGKCMGASELGIFSKSDNLSRLPTNVLNNIVNRLALPVLVELDNEPEKAKVVTNKIFEMLSFISFGAMLLLASLAKPLVILLWTEKWSDAIIILQILCVGICWFPISSVYLSLMQLFKRTDLTLKTELIKKPILIILLIAGIPFGIVGIAIASALYNIYDVIVNMLSMRMILEYSFVNQLMNVGKYWLIAVISAGLSITVSALFNSSIMQFFVGFSVFVVFYCLTIIVLRFQGLSILWELVKGFNKTPAL